MANSTLNSKLASPSLIAAYTVVGAGKRAETLYVNSSGTATTVTFGMRQAKGRKAYYQVQYRWHYRYTGTQAVAHGADWTDFTDWQTPVAIAATTSQTTAIAAGSTASPDTWQRANYAPNKSYDYLRILDQSVTIGSNYDAVSYQLRARVYDYATNKHGSWVYSETIKVFKAAEVSDVTLHTGADGALDIDYNYKWDRGKALFVTIVKDASGRNLLRDTFKRTPVKQAGSVDGVDGTRSATNTIPLDLLKRKVQPNEVLRLNAYLATYDGARTYLPKPLTVNGEDAELGAPRITVAKDNARGVLQVKVYKTDADDDLGFADLDELDVGIYYLVETSAPAGYVLPEYEYIKITVDTGEVTYQAGTAGEPRTAETITRNEQEVYLLEVYNSAGVELPAAGGPGTSLIYLLGIMLTAIAGAVLLMKRRPGRAG